MAQIRPEGAPIQSSDPILSTRNTVGSGEDRMEHEIELTDHVSGGLDEDADKTEEFNLDVDIEVIVKDKGSGEKEGSTTKTVSTVRPDISAARPEMKSQKAKEKGVAFKDADDSARPIRSITTLQPFPTIDPKDKGRFTPAQLKSRSFEEIHKLYTKEHKWVDAFVPIGSEEDEKRVGSRKKRAVGSSSKQTSPKKQKVNDQESIDSDKELRKCLKVVPDDDKAINYETLDVKSPIVKVLGTMEAGDVNVYKLSSLDGSYRHFLTFSKMLEVLDRQDVLDLHKIVMERFLANDPEGYDMILWRDLKTLMESSKDDKIWRNQQDWKLLSWKLYETYGVHTLMLDDSLVSINIFVEKRYPLTKEILEKMLSWRLEAKTKSTLALDLIKFIKL
nr:hypothetical protein [Tanacetum cinerariifolium]